MTVAGNVPAPQAVIEGVYVGVVGVADGMVDICGTRDEAETALADTASVDAAMVDDRLRALTSVIARDKKRRLRVSGMM